MTFALIIRHYFTTSESLADWVGVTGEAHRYGLIEGHPPDVKAAGARASDLPGTSRSRSLASKSVLAWVTDAERALIVEAGEKVTGTGLQQRQNRSNLLLS